MQTRWKEARHLPQAWNKAHKSYSSCTCQIAHSAYPAVASAGQSKLHSLAGSRLHSLGKKHNRILAIPTILNNVNRNVEKDKHDVSQCVL